MGDTEVLDYVDVHVGLYEATQSIGDLEADVGNENVAMAAPFIVKANPSKELACELSKELVEFYFHAMDMHCLPERVSRDLMIRMDSSRLRGSWLQLSSSLMCSFIFNF